MKRIFLLVDDERTILRVCERALWNASPLQASNGVSVVANTKDSARQDLRLAIELNVEEIRFFVPSFDLAVFLFDEITPYIDQTTQIAIISDGTVIGSTTHSDGIEFLLDMRHRFQKHPFFGTLASSESDFIHRAERLEFTTIHKDGFEPLQNVIVPAYKKLRRL
jgi:hypothetical protein